MATGTGFAPFASILRDAETWERYEDIIVMHIRCAFQRPMEGHGLALMEILTMCPTGWFVPPGVDAEYMMETLGKTYGLGEIKDAGADPFGEPRETGRAGLERELRQVTTDHRKLVDAIIAGVHAEQVKDRMIELDARRKELKRALSATPARDPLRIHPGMARTYRKRIGQLILGLSEAERMDEAKEALRALVEKIELVPVAAEAAEGGKPGLAIHLHGALASLLRLACGLPVHEVVGAAAQTQKAPCGAGHGGANSAQPEGAKGQAIYIIV